MVLNINLVKVYEVLDIQGPFVPAVDDVFKEAGIRSSEDVIAAKDGIKSGSSAGLPPGYSQQFLDFIAWHENFCVTHKRDPDIHKDLTKEVLENFRNDQKTARILPRHLQDFRRLQNSAKASEAKKAKKIYGKIRRLKDGVPRMVDVETTAIMGLLPDELKNNPHAKFDSEGCVRTIVEAFRVKPFSSGLTSRILIPGMTQIGKTKVKVRTTLLYARFACMHA